MAVKRSATKRKPSATKAVPLTALDKFTGLTGMYKQATQVGINSIVAMVMVYSTTVMIPNMMEKHSTNMKEAREEGFSHGEKAVERLAKSIDRLGETFEGQQSKVRNNQGESIAIQKRMVEILEGQGDSPVSLSPRPDPIGSNPSRSQ